MLVQVPALQVSAQMGESTDQVLRRVQGFAGWGLQCFSGPVSDGMRIVAGLWLNGWLDVKDS